MGCLDDATMFEMAHGQLPAAALARADAHVDSCPDCRVVLAGLLRTVGSDDDIGMLGTLSSDDAASPSGEPVQLGRGSQLGRYLILDVVGGGAMGIVYSAYDPDLHRRVALKLLRAETAALTRERMMREAQAMARLQHPNVVGIYEVGEANDSIFIAMELVSGDTLTRWMRSGARSVQECVEIFGQAARGLAAAHRAGLVHRDFKPDNVIVDDEGRVRVTDFGLARGSAEGLEPGAITAVDLTASEQALSQSLTRTGAVIGTPAYMAPEQFRGEVSDARSDQFSFCVALWEAVHGERPFRGATWDELRASVLEARVPDQRRSGVPRWLQNVLTRGLCADPAARFESMDAIVAELELDRARPQRWLVPGALFAAVAAAALTIALTSKDPRAACAGAEAELAAVWNDQRRAQIRSAFAASEAGYANRAADTVLAALDGWSKDWTRMHTATCRATRIDKTQSEALLDVRMACMKRHLDRLDAVAAELSTADRDTVANAANAASALGSVDACADTTSLQSVVTPGNAAQAKAVAELRRELAVANALFAAGRYDRASAAIAPLIGRAESIGFAPATAEANLIAARVAMRKGHHEDAEARAYASLWAAQAGRDDHAAAAAWLTLLDNAGVGGRYDHAAHLGNHASAAIDRVGAPPRLRARMTAALGLIAYNRGAYEEANQQLGRALELSKELHGDRHIDVARAHTNLGNLARARAQYDTALVHHRTALRIDTELRGKGHPVLGRHLHNIAGVLRLQGKPRQALQHYTKALAVKRAALGAEHHEVALTQNSIGLVHFDLGDIKTARAHFERALAGFRKAKHGETGLALHNLGLAEAAQSDHRAALEHFAEALGAYQSVHGDRHERVARLLVAMGRSALALGDKTRARAWATRANGIAAASDEMLHIAAEATRILSETRRARPRRAEPAPRPVRLARPQAPETAPKPGTKPQPPPQRPGPKRTTGPVYGPSQAWD